MDPVLKPGCYFEAAHSGSLRMTSHIQIWPLSCLAFRLPGCLACQTVLSPSARKVLLQSVVRISHVWAPAMHSLAGQFVHVQSHRTFLITLLVVLRHVHVALSVARVIGHPHRHRSASNCQLSQQHDTFR